MISRAGEEYLFVAQANEIRVEQRFVAHWREEIYGNTLFVGLMVLFWRSSSCYIQRLAQGGLSLLAE